MPTPPAFLLDPSIRLYGSITEDSLGTFLDQLSAARKAGGPLVLELTTNGGDADIARRIALEMRLCREQHGCDCHVIGKTSVLSAGVTILASVPAAQRYLTRDTVLLVHERRLGKSLDLSGPISANIQIVREQLAELESARRIEREGFAALAEGSRIPAEELTRRALDNYYLTAEEALELGLVAGLV